MEKKAFLSKDFEAMERFYRVDFFNTISGLRTPFLAGTHDGDGVTNVAIFNSVVHIGANPPSLGMIFRPTNVTRHTYENIKKTGEYTLNLVSLSLVEKAHQTSAKYPGNISEFDAVEIEVEQHNDFSAPFVAQSPLQLAMEFREEHIISLNNTILVVGEIKAVFVDENAVGPHGEMLHDKLETALVSGLDAYYGAEKLFNIEYARP